MPIAADLNSKLPTTSLVYYQKHIELTEDLIFEA